MAKEGQWDIIITSLQDVCNTNEATSFDNVYKTTKPPADGQELEDLLQQVKDHQTSVQTSQRLVETCQQSLQTLTAAVQKPALTRNRSSVSKSTDAVSGKDTKRQKVGRSIYVSKYNPSEPIIIGSEVGYKLRNRHTEEWIQCEVTKVIGDGTKFEVKDPEPDENNNPGQTFKANFKEIILIPTTSVVRNLPNYTYGTKVLARYPETTTFYPAVVVGSRKDKVKLKFDGEEEANKETEVERRLVLPFPQ